MKECSCLGKLVEKTMNKTLGLMIHILYCNFVCTELEICWILLIKYSFSNRGSIRWVSAFISSAGICWATAGGAHEPHSDGPWCHWLSAAQETQVRFLTDNTHLIQESFRINMWEYGILFEKCDRFSPKVIFFSLNCNF